jgi:hypothetical protein
VQVLHLAPGCLTEQDQMDGYIYGLDCQDAKFMNLGPNEFVLSPKQIKADVVPLGAAPDHHIHDASLIFKH